MDISNRLEEFLRDRYYSELARAVREEQAAVIDFMVLDRVDPLLADQLLENPEEILKAFNQAARSMLDEKANVRIRNLPASREIRIRNLRAKHMGKLMQIDTIMKAASEVKPQIYEAVYQCPTCSAMITMPQETNILQKPWVCDCGYRGDFTLVEKKMYDIRWLVGVEPFELTTGERPGEISILLKEDLTTPRMQKKTDPGNRIKVVGILKELPKRIKGKLSTKMDTYIEAVHVEPSEIEFEELDISEEDEKRIKELASDPEIYEKIKASVAPGIYGFDEIKEAIVLQLFSGIAHTLPDNTRIRGNIHVLITGDPGVGKTVLLKLVSSVVPRGRYVSGSGVSGAGLCTTYDTLVVLGNGEIRKIGELVEERTANMEKTEEGIFACDGDNLTVIALDQKELKLKPMRITKYWKIKSPEKLIKIVTRTGKEIKVTENNPIPLIENAKLIWKYAKDIKKGDYLACPRKLVCKAENEPSLVPDKTSRLVNCGETISVILDEIKKTGTIKEFIEETGVSKQGLYWRWKNEGAAPTIETLEIIGNKAGMNIHDILPQEMVLTQHRGTFIKLPKNLNEEIMYFFGLIAGDGNIGETNYGGLSLRFHSASKELLDKFSQICKNNFGIEPEYYKHPERIAYLRINSKILGKIANTFGIPSGKKSQRLKITEDLSRLPDNFVAAYLRGLFDTDGFVSERSTRGSNYVGFTTASKEFAHGISLLLLRFGIISRIRERKPSVSEIRGKKVISKKKYEVEIKGLSNLLLFKDSLGFEFTQKRKKLERIIAKISSENTNIDLIPNISILLRKARNSAKMTAKELYGYKNYAFEKARVNPSRKFLSKIVDKMQAKGAGKFINQLETLASSDIFWDEVKSADFVEGEDYVYDLTVDKEHSFVANGMIIHNTATVVKNEAIGGWILEAGALILCNKGLIAIDEFDKMSRDDQIAMHEATSIETVSIAKASIVATLPAQTAVLAAANPKFGRFDITRSIVEQIDIPETLLSRFDLKFALTDKPDKAQDERLAEHIIISRKQPEKIQPLIGINLLRKYIAYAKQITEMELTEEAALVLKDFYVDMRNRYSTAETSVVSITLRQYEALLRLAEASAKIRLDSKIRLEDAERAIKLMKYSLMQLGYDVETGRIDIDKLESGITASKRKRITTVIDIIDALQKETGREVAVADVMAAAEEQGLTDVEDILDELKRQGAIFEPRSGFVRKI